jgi:hypothetical protein
MKYNRIWGEWLADAISSFAPPLAGEFRIKNVIANWN